MAHEPKRLNRQLAAAYYNRDVVEHAAPQWPAQIPRARRRL